MATDLAVYGPFNIPFGPDPDTGKGKKITKEHVQDFWEEDGKKVRSKEGCWVFGLKIDRSIKPWYVGKTTDRFKDASLTPSKRTIYNKILAKSTRGKPVMFFVAPRGNAKSVPTASVSDLWVHLAQYAMARNDKLRTVQSLKSVPKWSITGLVRSGAKPSTEVKHFKKMLDI
ncbi:MAG: hypothetical protein D6E12_03475 [Desulfovibrio sp.]|nr:MAG: hypothetical protein D6E12_03475 [Desulfovibrio sp.]